MERSGHEVSEAFDGEEGVYLYRQAPADLVITDILMHKNGLEVIRGLRDDFPDVKIIAITGYDPDLLCEAKQLGASHTFRKPFGLQPFGEAVEELLEQENRES